MLSSANDRSIMSPRAGRGIRLVALAAVLCLLLLLGFGTGRASAALTTAANCALPGSSFQGGDGNQDTPTLPEQTFCTEHLLPTTTDWQTLKGVINSPDPQAQDSMFAGGNKESAPGSWVLETQAGGVTPGKSNIVSGWSQADPQPAATFLDMAFEREASSGDTFLTFELNQVKGLWENPKKAKIPCRTTGDVLISYNVGGGEKVSVVIYRWVTDTSKSTVIEPDPTPHACALTGHFEPEEGTAVKSPLSQGAMNATEITNYLTDTANETPAKFAAGKFGEAALNLTGFFEHAKLGSCFAFGQMWMSSRSSESIESQLQDYVGPVAIQTNSCSISGRKFDDANGSGVNEASKPGLEGWTIQLLDSTGTKVLQTTTTGSGGSYSFTNVAPGTYVIREVGQTGWSCTYPGAGGNCQYSVTLNSENINSTGNDFGNKPATKVTTVQSPTTGIVGTKFGDSATVSGPVTAPAPTGNVEFRLYSDEHCGTQVAGPIVEPLSKGVATIPDAAKVAPAAGSYWWVATYEGDKGNAAGKSGCADEPITVGKVSPEVTTTQEPASGTVGDTFKDKATIAGLFGAKPAGSVSWKLYDNSKCEAAPVASDGPVNVTGNGSYTTPSGASPAPAGTYYWVATYTGDANNKEAASGCAAEPITVGKASPEVTTTQEPASGTVGDTFKDKATIAGLFGAKPAGSVSWKLYDNSKCEAPPVASDGPVNVTGNGSYTTPSGASPAPAGTYYWVATYTGDANNKEAASGCAAEPITVGKASPEVTTTQEPASGTVGDTFKDKATIAGLFGAKPAGSVSWKLYDNSKCEAPPVASDGPVNVTGNGSYTTPSGASPVSAGTYYWVATYSGDVNNEEAASGCAAEPITVGKASPEVTTTQAPASGVVGVTFKDKATIAGLFGANPAGSVSWKLYDNSKCEAPPVASDGPVNVTGNGSYTTPSGASPVPAGTYYWVATYTGDANNKEAASGCAAEPINVEKATPAVITAQMPASGTVGATFNDKATLSGLFGAKPAGSVSWKLYDNSKCEAPPVASDGPVNVTGNGSYTTPSGASPAAAGTYYWVATYTGDANNKEVSSGCADEPVKIGVATPEVTTSQEPASGTVGDTFKDKATIAGLFGAKPAGSVSWKLYGNSKCEAPPVASDGPVNVTGNGSYTTPSGASPVSAGTYYWVATYSGDVNNEEAASGCAAEPITVGKASPEVTTTQAPASGVVGVTFKDKATIAGLFGANPAGSVSWKLYDNSKCEAPPVASDGPVNVTGNGSYTTPSGASPVPAGTYYWVATYTGDANNKEAASGCAAEPINVEKATPAVITAQMPASGTVGATFNDKATLSGLFGAKPAGSVSWKLYDNSKCEAPPVASDGPVNVTGNGSYTTPSGASPAPAGTYYWVATYTGDANNKEVSSGCADEPVKIGVATPEVTTSQEPASGTVGDTFKDKATIAGLFGAKPAGSVSWKLYGNSKCEAPPVASDGPVNVTGNGSYTTPSGASPVSAGTYYWVATYSGDVNNEEAASGCAAEPITVGKASPEVTTTQAPASGVVGVTFKDKATIAGLFGANPAGSVSWKLYDNSKCEAPPVASDGPVLVTGNGSYTTPSGASPVPAGTYYWVATYTGDANNKEAASGCAAEPINVEKATPAVITAQMPASGTVGATFNDKATLSGLFGAKPAGSVSWKLYDNSKCEAPPVASDGPVNVTGNGSYTTPAGASPAPAGTYYWVATYTGDANNKEAASGCADEPVEVEQATPSIATTQQPASGLVGSTFKDEATLAGLFGANPGGSVSWKLYDNSKCEGGPVASDGPVTVTGNGGYATPAGAAPAAAGTYYWVATYGGDANNKAVSSGCADEPINVGAQPIAVVLSEQVVSGVALGHGPAGCAVRATPLYITGRQIQTATFYLDGHKVKTVTSPNKAGRWGITVSAKKLRYGAHHVKVVVAFDPSSQTAQQTVRILLVRCRPPHVVFTG